MRLATVAFIVLTALTFTAPRWASAADTAKSNLAIKDGMLVSMEYTLKGADGKVIDTSKGGGPFKYVHGQKSIVPGLERELTGMKARGEKNVTVKPEDAYGPVHKDGFQEIPRDKLPPNGLKVGAILRGQDEQGRPMKARVHEIKEKSVIIDMNHPLAGKTLYFNVKIVDVQPGPPASAPAKAAEPAKPTAQAQPAKPAEPAKK